ncbi:MAG: alpha/beta hydrolase [Alphaproteobacteria bacterium]
MNGTIAWDDFQRERIETDHGPLLVRSAGAGRPLLLLHGFPQTGHTFRLTAPALTDQYRVIVPDLPGYGASPGPTAADNGAPFDRRSVAHSLAAMMTALGHDRFLLVGHDRGARAAYRLALDFPEKVAGLVSIDTVPTVAVWEAMTYRSANHAFHWPLLAQPAPLVEAILHQASDDLIGHLLERWAGTPLTADATRRYLEAYRKPSVQAGAAADYRAGAGLDLEADRADRAAGQKLACPLLVPYGTGYTTTDPEPDWRVFADDIRTIPIDCGHFVQEEAPDALIPVLRTFLQTV